MKLQVLLAEHDRIGNSIHGTLLHLERFFAVAVSAIVGIIAFATADQHYELLVLLAFALLLVQHIELSHRSEIRALSGYKKWLEERIDVLLDEREPTTGDDSLREVLKWELVIAPNLRNNAFDQVMFDIAEFAVSIGAVVSGVWAIGRLDIPSVGHVLLGVALVGVLATVVLNRIMMETLHERGYRLACDSTEAR